MSSVIEITDSDFKQEANSPDKAILVYFWAGWCGPCRLVSPSITWAAQEYSDRLKVLKLEIDPNPNTVTTYKVEGVPALRLLKSDQVVASHEGVMTKAQLKTFLDENLT